MHGTLHSLVYVCHKSLHHFPEIAECQYRLEILPGQWTASVNVSTLGSEIYGQAGDLYFHTNVKEKGGSRGV